MDELIAAMSVTELQTFKTQYADNASIVKIIDGYIVIKEQQAVEAKDLEDFGKTIDKMVNKLNHPEGIHNVYLGWGEVEVEDTSVESEQVEIVVEPPIVDEEGKITTPAVTTMESRYPKVKVFRWNVELNKGFSVQRTPGSSTGNASKRAITVKRIWGDKAPELMGNFRSAKEACQHLNLIVGTDSAMRVLTNRNPYLAIPYDGTDFKVSE